jgi:hypothetical protein
MRWIATLIVVLTFASTPLVGALAPARQLMITAPADRAAVDGPAVTVRYEVNGVTLVPPFIALEEAGTRPEANRPDQGHLHFMLDTFPLAFWGEPDSYTFNDVPSGEHQLAVELVQNDHSPFSPPVAQQIRFRTAAGASPAANAAAAMSATMPVAGQLPPELVFRHALLLLAGLALAVGGLFLRWMGVIRRGLAAGRAVASVPGSVLTSPLRHNYSRTLLGVAAGLAVCLLFVIAGARTASARAGRGASTA